MRLVGADDAPHFDLSAIGERQNYGGALNSSHFLDDRPGAVPHPRPRLPLLQHFPQDVAQETHEDVRLDPILFLVPDRPNGQVALVDSERGLRLGQLDVRLPQVLGTPVPNVRSEQVTPLAVRGPLGPRRIPLPPQAKTTSSFRGVLEGDLEGSRPSRVPSQEAPHLTLHWTSILGLLGPLQPPAQTLKSFLNPQDEAIVHRLLF